MRDKHPIATRFARIRTDLFGFTLSVIAVGAIIFFLAHVFTSPSLPSPVGENCGTSTDYYIQPPSAAPANCLWHAYLKCQTATLTNEYHGIDTGETHVIIVQRGSDGCAITDTAEAWSDNGVGHDNITSYSCTSMGPPINGTMTIFGCGTEGDLGLAVASS